MVGRDADLRTIMRILDSPADQPPIVVLQGEPGIGKTTLWLAGIGQARQRGFRVLSCRPSAAEAQLSYASLADLLADIDDDLLKFLPDPQRRAIDFVLLRGGCVHQSQSLGRCGAPAPATRSCPSCGQIPTVSIGSGWGR